MGSLLTANEFLTIVWPISGPYCIAYPIVLKDGNKGYAHRACDTIDDAVTLARSLCYGDLKDVFFAVHALKQGRVMNPDTGKYKVSRKHDNMREGKVFFFDLDVGEGNHKYASKEQALANLQRFVFRTRLPDPLVVSSGGGYHAYWVITDPIASEDWRGYADRMRWLAAHHGMLVDPTRTTDQSSVLRVVGTKNYKPHVLDRVRAIAIGDVTDTAEFLAALVETTEHYTPLATLVASSKHQTGNMGTSFDGRMTPPDEVFEVCEQMREFRDSQGNLPEPAWFVSVGTIRWVENGEELVHEISQGDPRYDEGETQAKIDHWADKSVPSCAKIALEFGNAVCDSCALRGKGKNPLDIANKVWAQLPRAAPTPTVMQLQSGFVPPDAPCSEPFGYFRNNGGIFKEVKDPAQQDAYVQKLMVPYDLYPIAKYTGSKLEPGRSDWITTIPLKGPVQFTMEDEWLMDGREFGIRMLANDVVIPAQNTQNDVRTYMLHYIQKLQKTAQATKVHDHYGWDYTDEGKVSTKTAFVINNRAFDIAENKWKKAAMSASMREGASFMGQDGTLDGYLGALEFYNRPQYRHVQFMYLAGLAVPFFYVSGEHGMLISATGKSGASKSATLKAIAGIWGSPERYVINGTPNGASQNAYGDIMMMHANTPFCMDEVTNQSTEAINNLAFGSTQASGRITMTQNRQLKAHRGGVRHSILFVSTNTSLVTLINAQNAAGQAGIARIIEIEFMKGPTNEKTAADRAIRALRQNYGHVGPLLLEGLLPKYEEIEAAIQAKSDKLNSDWTLGAVERFTGSCCAVMYEVATRAYDLGLHRFDVDEAMVWFEEVQLKHQRDIMSDQNDRSNPMEVLTTYISQYHGEAVRVDDDGKGNISGVLSIPNTRNLAYRFDIHTSEIWIRAEHFSRYCLERRLNLVQVIQELTAKGVVKGKDRRSMLAGIPGHPILRGTCYIVDANHPRLSGTLAAVSPVT